MIDIDISAYGMNQVVLTPNSQGVPSPVHFPNGKGGIGYFNTGGYGAARP